MKKYSTLFFTSTILFILLFLSTSHETAHAKNLWGKPPELEIKGLYNGQTTSETKHVLYISTAENATVTVLLNDEILESKDNPYEIKLTKEGKNIIYVSSTLNGKKSKELIEVIYTPKKITNRAELQVYLRENYSVLQTKLKKVTFDIKVYEGTNFIFNPSDYTIELGTRYIDFIGTMNQHLSLNKNDTTAKEDVELSKMQYKEFIENMAKDIIAKFPDKKIFGYNDESYYRYPNLKMDYQMVHHLNWSNFEPINMKNTWPGSQPEDYSSVIYGAYADPTSSIYRKYKQDERQRDNYRWEYQSLKYDDFKITEFNWLPFLEQHYSNYLNI